MSGAPVKAPSDLAELPENEFEAESHAGSDSVLSFKTEEQLAGVEVSSTERRHLQNAAAALIVCGIVGAGSWFGWQTVRASRKASAVKASLGTAFFRSLPDGATIAIDGLARGTTPIKLSLAAGQYTVTIKSGDVSRTLPLVVEAGGVMSQYFELAPQLQLTGGLDVVSDPSGAEVRIDGTLRGTTPLTVADVAVGPHKVTVSKGDAVVNRTVSIARGMTATLVFSGMTPAVGAAGWLTIDAPIELEVYEGGQLLGTTRSDRIMLAAGSHDLNLTNTNLEFTGRRTVKVLSGKTATVNVTLPSGKLSVNAVPWAEISIDGRPAGTTPMANLTVPVGSHEVLWRHPQLGERRQTVTVKANTPTRVGVDLSK